MFSSRVPSHLESNRVARAVDRARAEGRPLLDLTVTNPTVAGIPYPSGILDPLSSVGGRRYVPAPLGMLEAREAVSRDYARRGLRVPADRIVLTSSTSEAYSLLFKLLCEPSGDAVMVPVPSYPLFDHLTRLDGVRPVPYRLEYHGRWMLDVQHLDEVWVDAVRAVLAVSPNNPTGSCLIADEIVALSGRATARGSALILDEVFADYPLAADTLPVQPAASDRGVTFRLGGLSKSIGLPQVKLGWIAVEGQQDCVREALVRLELICDTYLSVSTPVQVAAPALLDAGIAVRAAILSRVRANHDRLRSMAARHPSVDVLHTEAGWSAVVRVPARMTEEELVLHLIESDDVLVHPGFFFDFAHEAFLVLSLLPEPSTFAEGAGRMLERVDG
jgi:aspartate/methionine/tyrosine aminotransferase